MYRQILIHPDDRNFQLILWRERPDLPIETYRLKTVTYGLTSSPYLAIKCLHELASSNANRFPETHKIILNDFYVDDLLTGADSILTAIKIRDEVTTMLREGGFELRKFASNHPQILEASNTIDITDAISLDKQTENKTLGVIWDHKAGSIKYSVRNSQLDQKYTKRGILSIIARLFDPLGLVSPTTITAKIILQKIWSMKLDWDDSLPPELHSQWLEFINNFPKLNELTIPRKVVCSGPPVRVEIHGFSDRSQNSYGACVYIRTIDNTGKRTCNLLCSKNRVAPLKSITIPRLELLAALLLAQLVNKLKQNLKIHVDQIICWTDSTIVLAWLKLQSTSLKTFVAHRVAKIQTLTSSYEWRYIHTSENPADVLSRGTIPQQLINNTLWWHGPQFLKGSDTIEFLSNNTPVYEFQSELPETKPFCCLTIQNVEVDFLNKYSSFSKLIRVMSYILRFAHNSKKANKKRLGPLSITEIQTAHTKVLKLVQNSVFSEDIHFLKKHGETAKTSKLRSLNPFLDGDGLLRVGGRLKNAPIRTDRKYQIILPKNNHITQLIIEMYHRHELHAGCQATVAAIRQKYWVISCRNAVRQVLFKCVTCFKANPTARTQLMGDLPKERVSPSRPFSYTAIDYAGPIIIKNGHGRTTKTIKSYIAIFVCFAIKAVHIELVCDCTSLTFLNALKKFMARRGKVSKLYSDNGTNFVGANRELNRLFKSSEFQTTVIDTLLNDHIEWQFIPPKSPHMNGLAEAAVKSTKTHLKRVLGNSLLNYEELYTLLTMIEACLNSRPITPFSNDPSDLSALTPGHFLIGDALTAPAEPDLTEISSNRLSRYQLLEKLRQHFWKRWSREYLHQMQQRFKWNDVTKQPETGDLVLLLEDNVPVQNWLLGRIEVCHPGADGLVRTVSVKTVKGVVKREVTKICPLPCDK